MSGQTVLLEGGPTCVYLIKTLKQVVLPPNLQSKSKSSKAAGMCRLWAGILSPLRRLDGTEGNSSHQSGVRRPPPPQTDGALRARAATLAGRARRVRAATCEAICSERADRRSIRMQHRDVLYVLCQSTHKQLDFT